MDNPPFETRMVPTLFEYTAAASLLRRQEEDRERILMLVEVRTSGSLKPKTGRCVMRDCVTRKRQSNESATIDQGIKGVDQTEQVNAKSAVEEECGDDVQPFSQISIQKFKENFTITHHEKFTPHRQTMQQQELSVSAQRCLASTESLARRSCARKDHFRQYQLKQPRGVLMTQIETSA